MKECLIMGVDVSKATLDVFFKPMETGMTIKNAIGGFKELTKELEKLLTVNMNLLVVMEHTGQYSLKFEKFLWQKGIAYCKVPALEIKRSMGMTRGKNDQVDAKRIAEYGWLRKDLLTADSFPENDIVELRNLLSLRAKLVKDRSGYISRLKEMKSSETCTRKNLQFITQEKVIEQLTKHIQTVEKAIRILIKSNDQLKKTSDLIQTIKGVGEIISAYMISCTSNFEKFKNPRKFLCFAGLAPFKHESGSSIKGKARISHLANKTAKTLLDRAACCAIQFDPELKAYYERRVREGKPKRSCINIIRAKIVLRIFAVVKRQTPYVDQSLAA